MIGSSAVHWQTPGKAHITAAKILAAQRIRMFTSEELEEYLPKPLQSKMPNHPIDESLTRYTCLEPRAQSKESLHQIDHTIIRIQHRHVAPFIECQARMRDVEANHVPNTNVVAWRNVHVGMLVHDMG